MTETRVMITDDELDMVNGGNLVDGLKNVAKDACKKGLRFAINFNPVMPILRAGGAIEDGLNYLRGDNKKSELTTNYDKLVKDLDDSVDQMFA